MQDEVVWVTFKLTQIKKLSETDGHLYPHLIKKIRTFHSSNGFEMISVIMFNSIFARLFNCLPRSLKQNLVKRFWTRTN